MSEGVRGKRLAGPLKIAAMAALCVVFASPNAIAEDGGLGGFFSHLFGAPAAKPPPPAAAPTVSVSRKPKKKVRDFVPATTTRAPGTPGGSPVTASFFIDVLGDSMGVLASDGLTDAFTDKPDVAIVDKARDASGLVNNGYFDWPKAANDLIGEKGKVDFVVIMLGINDLQPMREGNEAFDPLTDKWRERYGQRVEAMLAPFRAAHIPVAWVGLPPMRTERVNAQAIKLNEIFKEHAEKAGAKYIDIWDAFADQSGQYDAFGPNIDGQNVKLRGSDGILFTKAGARKLAHFLESDIRKSLDKAHPATELASLPPDIEQAADDINAQIRREMGAPPAVASPAPAGGPSVSTAPAPPPVPLKPLAGPIFSLSARPNTPGGVLAARGAPVSATSADVSKVIRDGEPPETRPGRSDDFSWRRL